MELLTQYTSGATSDRGELATGRARHRARRRADDEIDVVEAGRHLLQRADEVEARPRGSGAGAELARDVFAAVGGLGAGQKNFFRNYAPPRFHAIGCLNVTTNFACPVGGNFFDHSGDDVEYAPPPACTAACASTP